ncbi:MAG: EscU/YscU/HrcU family type III secretion system export apparatus switch protein [Synergistaceae bacterium]|nr:EscU/YscU/HrcU family type III secretion system export apparatus switch protein [Synergistaceae bacterium]
MENNVSKAAALKYDENRDRLPRVTAAGHGRVADRMVEAAFEAEVPVVEDAALVSALLMLELGDEIPVELYQTVARILAFLYDLDRRNAEL